MIVIICDIYWYILVMMIPQSPLNDWNRVCLLIRKVFSHDNFLRDFCWVFTLDNDSYHIVGDNDVDDDNFNDDADDN